MKQQKILLLGALGFAGYKLFIEDDKQKIVYDSTNPPIDTKIGKRKKNNGLDLSSVNPELPNVSGTQTVGVGSDQFELSLIPIETEPNHFSPQLFPVTMYGTIFHSELGFELPKLIFSLQTSFSKIYKDLAVDYTKRGIWESTDYHLHKTEGMEWNLFEDEFYQNDISKRTGINRNTWITSIPMKKRYLSYGGNISRAKFDSITTAQEAYNLGRDVSYADEFGSILTNGINELAMTNIDWETDYENGFHPEIGVPFIYGACKSLKGLFQAMYLWYAYPDETSRGYPVNNQIPIADINPLFNTTVNLNGENLDLKTLNNLFPLIEISRFGEEDEKEGYNDGVRVLTHFGTTRTARHYLKRTVAICEKNYWGWRKLGKKFIGVQTKTVCDSGATGWQYQDGNRSDGKQKTTFSRYLSRDKAFKSSVSAVFSGCHIHEWDRPNLALNFIIDGYNGLEGARELLGHKFLVNGVSISFADLRDNEAYFALWETMYKMAGQTEYRIIEGCNLDNSKEQILVRVMTSGKYICVWACDAYNTITSHDFSVKHQNNSHKFEKSFTINDWKSCYPNIPVDLPKRNDYVFGIYEMEVR